MNYNKWMREDKVSYVGSKFASELRGKLGVIIVPVGNSENSYVVNFGKEDFVVSGDSLSTFHGKVHADGDSEESKGMDVQKRKTTGGKRRNDQESE